jgi:hypothetical protein
MKHAVLFFFAARGCRVYLLRKALVAFFLIMFSLSHDFKHDLFWILLADICKKQCIKFINPSLILVLKRENNEMHNFKQRIIDGRAVGFAKFFRL